MAIKLTCDCCGMVEFILVDEVGEETSTCPCCEARREQEEAGDMYLGEDYGDCCPFCDGNVSHEPEPLPAPLSLLDAEDIPF